METPEDKTPTKPIRQKIVFDNPTQIILLLKRCQGPQKGDIIAACPMVHTYAMEMDMVRNQLRFQFDLAAGKPPEDWQSEMNYQTGFIYLPPGVKR